MKKFQFIAMLLCVAAFATLSSCSKDDDSSSSSQNNSSSSQIGNYTLGKYHPSKKISKLTIYANEGMYTYNPWTCYCDFTWDGDKIRSIKYTGKYGEIITYNYSYYENGYISSINDNEVKYSKNRVKMFKRDLEYGDNEVGFGVFGFDDNGQLIRMNYDEVNMVNGNPQGWVAHGEEMTFDNHPNPFKNIILPETIYYLFGDLVLDAAPISANNSQYHEVTYETEDANAYPTRFRGSNSTNMIIEYLN